LVYGRPVWMPFPSVTSSQLRNPPGWFIPEPIDAI